MNMDAFQECESCACFSARRTARLLTQYFDKRLRSSGLRATQFTLLVALIRIGKPASPAWLSEFLGLERTTLTRNLQTLEANQYIQIEAGQDRRTRFISITKQGISIAKKAFPIWQKAQAHIARHIPPQELKTFAIKASNIH